MPSEPSAIGWTFLSPEVARLPFNEGRNYISIQIQIICVHDGRWLPEYIVETGDRYTIDSSFLSLDEAIKAANNWLAIHKFFDDITRRVVGVYYELDQ